MSKKWKVIWLGIGGAALLLLGISVAVYGTTQTDAVGYYGGGVTLIVVGISVLWHVIWAWQKMKERGNDDWPPLAVALFSSTPYSDEHGAERPAMILMGLWVIGLFIYPFIHAVSGTAPTVVHPLNDNGQFVPPSPEDIVKPPPYFHLSETVKDPGTWIYMGFLGCGILWLIGGLHTMMVEYRRIAAQHLRTKLTTHTIPKKPIKTKILITGLAAFILTCLFPPWLNVLDVPYHAHQRTPAGHEFILFPPESIGGAWGVEIDLKTLFVEWAALAAITGAVWLVVVKPPWLRDDKANRPQKFIPPPGNPKN